MPQNTIKEIKNLITRSLLERVVDLLNMLTSKDRVYVSFKTSTIVEVGPNVDMRNKNIAFGSYAMVHIGTTNKMKTICVTKCLLKVSNDYGGYYFMNIFTGKLMHICNWK